MPTLAALRDRYSARLVSFAWDEWAQMGVLATPQRASPWAQDPEALIVFTLEVARNDPRLFDEVLDWFVMNESLVSTRRLRAMCTVDGDAPLVNAALAWVGRYAGSRQQTLPGCEGEMTEVFRGAGGPVPRADESFRAYGLLRPELAPSGKSGAPDMRAPVNLAFRLRQIVGVGARAEVVRALLTIDAPSVDAAVLTRAAGFTRRNVSEAISALDIAGVLSLVSVGREQRVAIDRERWRAFLGEPPGWRVAHRDWPQLLSGLRRILRWLWRADLDDMSDYMRASQARDLLEQVHEDFAYAGIPVEYGPTVSESLTALDETISRGLAALEAGGDQYNGRLAAEARIPPSGTLMVYSSPDGRHAWALRASNGHEVARSASDYGSQLDAIAAARRVLDNAVSLDFEVLVTSDGTFWWQARGANGAVVSRSPDTFATRFNATRAVRRAQEMMGEMRPVDFSSS